MSSWIQIDPKHLSRAMKECKQLGLKGVREKFGFHPANKVHMFYGGIGPFEARVLVL